LPTHLRTIFLALLLALAPVHALRAAEINPVPHPILDSPKVTDPQWWLQAAHEEADLATTKRNRSILYVKLCAIAVRAQRFDKAKQWIDQVNIYEREQAWGEVAKEYARLGMPQEAMDSIANMGDAAIRDKALIEVVIRLAKNDKNAEAVAAAEKIHDNRLRLVAKDTEAGVRAMQIGLEGSPEAALKVIMQTNDPDRQVGAVRRIVWWIGKQNQPKRAVPFLASLQDSGVRDLLLSGLAEGLAEAGNVPEAMDRIDSINDLPTRTYTYAQVAETFARAKNNPAAEEAIKKISEIKTEPGLTSATTLLRMAEATYATGDAVKARALWFRAYDEAEDDRVWREIRDEEIGKSQVDARDLDSAWATAMHAKEPTRILLLEMIAKETVLANGQEKLLKQLAGLKSHDDRLAVLIGATAAFFPDREFQGHALKPEVKTAPAAPKKAEPRSGAYDPPKATTTKSGSSKSGSKSKSKDKEGKDH
jgi:tetratricopeptide (TPR) repeat protein